MSAAQLYRRYTRAEAVVLFGPAEKARDLCDGQWAVLPEHVLGFVDVGELPRQSCFTSASRFCWTAERPYEFPDPRRPSGGYDPAMNFLPLEVRAGRERDLPIHLFVRRFGDDPYLHVGRLQPSCGWGSGTPGLNFGHADFRLSPPLPSRVWAELGGLRPDGLDHAAIDASLARLGRPLPVLDRLEVLRQLAEYWHGRIGPDDGLPGAYVNGFFPLPLRWWHAVAGRRHGIVDGHNILFDQAEARPVGGSRLMFLSEAHGGYGWVTLWEREDPPVWGSVDCGAKPWVEYGVTLSEFLIQSCIFEAVNRPAYTASARVDAAAMARLSALVPPLPLAAWHWPVSPTRFHAGGGAFLVCEQFSEDSFAVQVGARTEHPLARLACLLDNWEYLDWSPPPVDPSWLAWDGGGVGRLARAIKDEGRTGDLPVLADALTEAGCDDEDILSHLREAGLHWRGCRVLDSLLGG